MSVKKLDIDGLSLRQLKALHKKIDEEINIMSNIVPVVNLPQEYKQAINSLLERYHDLIGYNNIMITVPQKLEIELYWSGSKSKQSATVDIFETFSANVTKTQPEVVSFNKEIQQFIQDVHTFGINVFNNKNWLWKNLINILLNKCDIDEFINTAKIENIVTVNWVPLSQLK